MKKRLIVGAALVACMVVLTLTSGLAQAQDPASSPTLKGEVEEDEGEAVALSGEGVTPQFVNPLRIFARFCRIGPRPGDTLFRCFNMGFSGGRFVTNVQCQLRNDPSQFINFPDQFACQVIGTTSQDNGSVWVRIRRLDIPGAGWGQNLRMDLTVID